MCRVEHKRSNYINETVCKTVMMLVISVKKFVTVSMERGNLTGVFCGEKKMTAVVLPCFNLFSHTVEVVNAPADKPYCNVSFGY